MNKRCWKVCLVPKGAKLRSNLHTCIAASLVSVQLAPCVLGVWNIWVSRNSQNTTSKPFLTMATPCKCIVLSKPKDWWPTSAWNSKVPMEKRSFGCFVSSLEVFSVLCMICVCFAIEFTECFESLNHLCSTGPTPNNKSDKSHRCHAHIPPPVASANGSDPLEVEPSLAASGFGWIPPKSHLRKCPRVPRVPNMPSHLSARTQLIAHLGVGWSMQKPIVYLSHFVQLLMWKRERERDQRCIELSFTLTFGVVGMAQYPETCEHSWVKMI